MSLLNIIRKSSNSITEIINYVDIKNYIRSEDQEEFCSLLRLDNSNLVLVFADSSLLSKYKDEINSYSNDLLIIILDKKKNKDFSILEIEEKEKDNENHYTKSLKQLYLILNNNLYELDVPDSFPSEKEYFHYLTTIAINKLYDKSLNMGYLDLYNILSSNDWLIRCNLINIIPNTDLKALTNSLVTKK